jgi:hypothetical protein
VRGLGELFEIVSVNYVLKKLRQRYKSGMIYLASNRVHSGRGFTRQALEEEIEKDGLKLVSSGFADAPPWRSNPKDNESKSLTIRIPFLPQFAKILFHIWIPLYERFYRNEKRAHIVWAFGQEDEK